MPTAGDLGNLNTKNWDNLQELADALEESWKKGQPIDLVECLPPLGTPVRFVILQELIKTDLECRWRHGQGVALDFYLGKFSTDLGPAQSLPPALVYEEYRVRQLFGDRPPLEQIQARFPNQFAEVERLLRESPLPSLESPGASAVPVPSRVRAGSHPAEMGHASFGKNAVLAQTGGYTLLERIGTGGFAEVWKAQAPGGVLKAIKIIIRPIDQAESKREQEAMELIKNLRHHFLLPVHAFWFLEDRLIILMDLADGSLRDCLNKYRKEGKQAIPLHELLRYFRQAAEALDYMHDKKVQHRDIKPENILLTDGNVRVADFGLAKAQGTERLMSGTFAGTFFYMPPETWDEKTHINGDQYSLAATYFELRTGRRLYKDTSAPALMHNHLHVMPCLDPLDDEEQQVLLKALSKNPEERYPDCLTFVRALERAVAAELPAASTTLPAAPGSPTATDKSENTIVPGQVAPPAAWRVPAHKPVGASADTYQDKNAITPTLARPTSTKSGRKLANAAAALVILGLLAFSAWIMLKPAPPTGDLTLLPLLPQTVRAGEAAAISVAIKRDNFTEPVRLTFSPDADISFEKEVTIARDAISVDVRLRAAEGAIPGKHSIRIEACGGAHCAYLVSDITIQPREN